MIINQPFGKYVNQMRQAVSIKKEMCLAIICGILLIFGFALSLLAAENKYISLIFYIGAYLSGGYYTAKLGISGVRRGKFEIDFLMLVAAIGAAALGEWAEGALLLFLFSLGHALEHYAMEKARRSIEALAGLAPQTALLKTPDNFVEVNIDTLKVGDTIIVKPNSKIAADGVVAEGSSSVNQAPITGESIPVYKSAMPLAEINPANIGRIDARHKVFAGSINGNGNLEILVTKVAADSTISRLVKLVNEAQSQKSPTQHLADKIGKYYVPVVLVLVTVLLFAFVVIKEPFKASFYRAMAVLVGASPCALAISTPSAVLSGVARAARSGVLIKGGKPLEDLATITAIAFDKTGTLTEGKPKLSGIYPLNGHTKDEVLETAIAVEKLSDHPLASAIVKDGLTLLGRGVPIATDILVIQGKGVKGMLNGSAVVIGNRALFAELDQPIPIEVSRKLEDLEAAGKTTMLVSKNTSFIGIVALMDLPRAEAKRTIQQLSDLAIGKMIMLTGDNQKVAHAIAADLGIPTALGNLLPQQKLDVIQELIATEKGIAMIGDGVNDAPAMAKSTVGIAMGAAGSDVALETADIALMADKLDKLPFAIALSRKARQIIKQNVMISLGMVAILIPLTMLGIARMGPAVIGHEGSTILVVFNALRLLVYKEHTVSH